ncbi:hypothetical protein [Haladaptatus sp. NG-WS-4]
MSALAHKDVRRECRSYGASIPADRTKCGFCLTNHLDNESTNTTGKASERTLLGVVHLLVESSTFYAGVAKGAAAATLLTKADRYSVVDDCQLKVLSDQLPAGWLISITAASESFQTIETACLTK